MLLSLLPALALAASDVPSISMVAPDGVALHATDHDLSTRVEGLVEHGELVVSYVNPEARAVEGRFEIVVPDGAVVDTVDMTVNGRWIEGVVVEQGRGRQVYGEYLHRIKRDPILLEADAGNRWRARIFPVAPHQHGAIRIGWTVARAEVGDPEGAVWAGRDLVARIVPVAEPTPDPPEVLEVLLDTSRSTVADRGRNRRVFEALRALERPIRVHAFDQQVALLYRGPSGQLRLEDLNSRSPLGATDVQAALDTVRGAERVLLVTDGVDPTGRVPVADVGRLDVWTPPGHADRVGLRAVATGVVFDDLDPERAAARLSQAVHTVELAVEDADWSWPRTARVQAGDPVVLHAELGLNAPVRVLVDGEGRTLPRLDAASDRIHTLVAGARIAAWSEEAQTDEAVRSDLVDLAVAHQLASPFTSWLVLESEAELARHGLTRPPQTDRSVASRGVATEATARSTVLTKDFLERIPAGRSYQSSVQMAPGVTGGGNPNMAGGATNENTYLLDGRNTTDPVTGTFSLGWGRRTGPRKSTWAPIERSSTGRAVKTREAPTRIEEVRTLMRRGDLVRAERRARQWAQAKPRLAAPLLMLGEVLHAADDDDEAARAFGSVAELVPGRADLLVLAAQRLAWLDPHDRTARLLVERATHLRPDALTHRALAMNQARRGELVAAVDTLDNWMITGAHTRGYAELVDAIELEATLLTQAAIASASEADRAAVATRLDALGDRDAAARTARTIGVSTANEGISPRHFGAGGRWSSTIGLAVSFPPGPELGQVDHHAPQHTGTLLGHAEGLVWQAETVTVIDHPVVLDPFTTLTLQSPAPAVSQR